MVDQRLDCFGAIVRCGWGVKSFRLATVASVRQQFEKLSDNATESLPVERVFRFEKSATMVPAVVAKQSATRYNKSNHFMERLVAQVEGQSQ